MTRPLLAFPLGLLLALSGPVLAACQPESDSEAAPLPGGAGKGANATSTDAVSSGAGGGGGEGGGAATIPPCEAIEGPFGTKEGMSLDPLLAFEGFGPGDSDPREVPLGELLACGGNDEVKVLVIYIDALWCTVCQSVAQDLAEKYETDWKPKGVAVISV